MDAYNNASFYNYNTIIYGHNMRDGSMFARLKEFSNEATLRQCPYFWLLLLGIGGCMAGAAWYLRKKDEKDQNQD